MVLFSNVAKVYLSRDLFNRKTLRRNIAATNPFFCRKLLQVFNLGDFTSKKVAQANDTRK